MGQNIPLPFQRFLVVALTALLHYGTAAMQPLWLMPFATEQLVLPLLGITVGLYLTFGIWVLLGVIIGYGLITLTLQPTLSGVPDYWLYGCGVLLQAFLLKVLLDKLLSYAQPKKRPTGWPVIMLLCTLVTSALTLLIQMLAISMVSAFPSDLAAIDMFTIWLSHVLSILFFAPLLTSLTANPYLPISRHGGRQLLIGASVYLFIAALFVVEKQEADEHQQKAFAERTQPFIEQAEMAQARVITYLQAMKGLFNASVYVDRDEFRIFTESLNDGSIRLRAMGWVPRVAAEQAGEFVKHTQRQGITDFKLKTLTHEGIKPAPPQAEYFPILYLEPLAGNRAALGLDVSTHPIVGDTVRKAINEKRPAVSPLLTLAQQKDKATGLIVYYPVFAVEDGAEQSGELEGMLEVVFEIDELLAGLLARVRSTGTSNQYSVRITYGEGNQFLIGEHSENPAFYHQTSMLLYDQKAIFEFFSTDAYSSGSGLTTAWLAHIFGMICGILVNLFIYFISLFNRSLSRQVEKKTKELRETNRKLKEANESQTTFLANMSHEIRTPLNGIMGAFQILEKATLSDQAYKLIKSGKTSSATLLKILNDILDISKIEAGKLELEILPTDINNIVEHTVEEFQPLAQNKSISLHLNIHQVDPKTWMVDPVRFKQILSNLISNAIKFTHDGEVSLALNKLSHGVEIVVNDSGIGMDEAALQKLFRRFEQADKSTTRKFSGTGLGMAITKQLVDMMEGTVKVKSTPNKGTEFCLFLPLTACADEKSESALQVNVPDLSTKTILVAEDNLINQEVILSLLEDTHAQVMVANNGEEAVRLFEENKPDIILMDIQMPVMDGIAACKEIRAVNRAVPIISVSANTYDADIQNYFDSGFNAHIAKPIELPVLYSVLAQWGH